MAKSAFGKVTCPECGSKQAMPKPKASCKLFYKCDACKRMVKATKSCCVFCDYGDKKCPEAENHKR